MSRRRRAAPPRPKAWLARGHPGGRNPAAEIRLKPLAHPALSAPRRPKGSYRRALVGPATTGNEKGGC
jgi:hypothetical protein